jgi:hypothetical protein
MKHSRTHAIRGRCGRYPRRPPYIIMQIQFYANRSIARAVEPGIVGTADNGRFHAPRLLGLRSGRMSVLGDQPLKRSYEFISVYHVRPGMPMSAPSVATPRLGLLAGQAERSICQLVAHSAKTRPGFLIRRGQLGSPPGRRSHMYDSVKYVFFGDII